MFGFHPFASDTFASTGSIEYVVLAQSITTGGVSIDSPTLTQNENLGVVDITTGAPVVDNARFNYPFVSTAITIAAPTIDNTLLTENHDLEYTAITIGSPTVDTTTLSIVHVLSYEVLISAPTVDAAVLTVNHVLGYQPLFIAQPTVDSPRMLGVPALSRVDIDYETSIVLTESRTDTVVDNDGTASFVIVESYDMLAEVA